MPDNYISGIDFGDGVVRKLKAEGGGVESLSELSDVNISTPASEQIIKFNGVTQKWENSNLPLIMITNIPATSDSFTYDGTEKTPTWSNYSSNQLQIGGDISATNAGTYTTTFTPKAGFCWDDYSTVTKSVTWTISKAAGEISIDKNEILLTTGTVSDTVTINNATGVVSVTSSNPTVISATLNGNVITITAEDTSANNLATITVSVPESSNYLSATVTISVSARFVFVYGVSWDGSSSSSMTRTDAAAAFTDPIPQYSDGNGGWTQGSSPFDNILPWSGMIIVEDENAGTLVKIPKFYYKWTKEGSTMTLRISPTQYEDFHVSPAHMDRGDGEGERDYVYVGRYHCSTGTPKSQAGSVYTYAYLSTVRNTIHQLGTDIWQWDFAMLWTIRMLYLVEFANWNSQATIGGGCGNNNYVESSGATDSMTYHTGKTEGQWTTYGHVQYRHIEDLWANVYDFVDGIRYALYKYYVTLNPADFSATSGGVEQSNSVIYNASGNIKSWNISDVSGYEWFLTPGAVGGEYHQYICDGYQKPSSDYAVLAGGSYYQTNASGLFFMKHEKTSSSSDTQGCRLMKLPNNS